MYHLQLCLSLNKYCKVQGFAETQLQDLAIEDSIGKCGSVELS
jgi:hypothetical protein